MSYNEVFGGAVLYPSDQTYLQISFSEDILLSWPVEQQIGGNVVADIMDLDALNTGLSVGIPDARQVSNGIQSVFVNIGSNDFTVEDNLGGTIVTVAPGNAWVAYLTDNTTQDGTWRTFQLGATVSVASASALAGAGIKAISTTLNQSIPPETRSTSPTTLVDADRAKGILYTGGVGILNLPDPVIVGADWFCLVRNAGAGNLTLTPASGLIDDAATVVLEPGGSAILFTDGTNFYTVGLGASSTVGFDFVEIAVPGAGDFVLSGVNLNRISYRFTGILTGDRKIVVPNTTQQYWVDNQTTGAFALRVGTAAQSPGVEVTQGGSAILSCDGTNVINASSADITFPIAISQGGTGQTTAAAALTALGGLAATDIVPQAEAEAGVATTARFWTAERVAQAITAQTTGGIVFKPADTARDSVTVPAPDPDLQVALGAAGTYAFDMVVKWTNPPADTDLVYRFGLTSGSFSTSARLSIESGIGIDFIETMTTNRLVDASANITTAFYAVGFFQISEAATFSFDWAQNSANISPTTIREGSWMRVTSL